MRTANDKLKTNADAAMKSRGKAILEARKCGDDALAVDLMRIRDAVGRAVLRSVALNEPRLRVVR